MSDNFSYELLSLPKLLGNVYSAKPESRKLWINSKGKTELMPFPSLAKGLKEDVNGPAVDNG